jgi:hypothetical protein
VIEHRAQPDADQPSSFYNSFGSKEKLYREATDAYPKALAVGSWAS